jgi:hypothetical protein
MFWLGMEYDKISVHEKRLLEHSDTFKNVLELPNNAHLSFLQRHFGKQTVIHQYTGAICLPPTSFRIKEMTILVEFLYSATLPNDLPFIDFHPLYRLADAFGMSGLLNKLMDYTQNNYATSGKHLEPKQISSIYGHRNAGHGQLWKYCCAQITLLLQSGNADME